MHHEQSKSHATTTFNQWISHLFRGRIISQKMLSFYQCGRLDVPILSIPFACHDTKEATKILNWIKSDFSSLAIKNKRDNFYLFLLFNELV